MPVILSDDEYAAFRELLSWSRGVRGPGVSNRPGIGASIGQGTPPRRRSAQLLRGGYFPAQVSGTGAGGSYTVTIYAWKSPIPRSPFTWATHVDTDAVLDDNGILLNQPEMDRGIARIDSGAKVIVQLIATEGENGETACAINYSYALRDLRFNDKTGCLEATTKDGEDLQDSDWKCKVPFVDCDATTALLGPLVSGLEQLQSAQIRLSSTLALIRGGGTPPAGLIGGGSYLGAAA